MIVSNETLTAFALANPEIIFNMSDLYTCLGAQAHSQRMVGDLMFVNGDEVE